MKKKTISIEIEDRRGKNEDELLGVVFRLNLDIEKNKENIGVILKSMAEIKDIVDIMSEEENNEKVDN